MGFGFLGCLVGREVSANKMVLLTGINITVVIEKVEESDVQGNESSPLKLLVGVFGFWAVWSVGNCWKIETREF